MIDGCRDHGGRGWYGRASARLTLISQRALCYARPHSMRGVPRDAVDPHQPRHSLDWVTPPALWLLRVDAPAPTIVAVRHTTAQPGQTARNDQNQDWAGEEAGRVRSSAFQPVSWSYSAASARPPPRRPNKRLAKSR